eukprot:6206029-Pleurochrysis_carterae.AAC.2
MMQGYAGGVGGGYAGGGVSIPVLEGQLRAFVDVADVAAALSCFDRLLRRRRTPHQTVCTSLLTLCVTNAPRSAMHVLEGMSEGRCVSPCARRKHEQTIRVERRADC